MDWKDTYRFLSLFREESETIVLGLLHENPRVENKDNYKGVKHFHVPLKQLKKPYTDWMTLGYNSKYFINHHNNQLGKGVYFVVNSGGTKNKEIDEIRSWFIDVDFGKVKEEFVDEVKANRRLQELEKTKGFDTLHIEPYESQKGLRYIVRGLHNQQVIETSKKVFLSKHKESLKDALIVETYSGFHGYWLSEKGEYVAAFKKVQRALVKKFNSDGQIIKEANLMRIPGFFHQKYPEKFLVNVVQWSTKRFTEEELIESLGLEIQDKQTKGFRKMEVAEKVSYSSDLTRTVTVIQRQRQMSNIVFRNIMPFGSVEKVTFNESVERVLKEPLTSFVESPSMNEGDSVLCPFHDDHTPSGTVYRSDLGETVYYCHSCEVGTRNVIGLYMLHTGKGWRKSVESLSKMIGLKVIETEFEREQFQKYRDNRFFFELDIKLLLPYTSKWIDRYGRRIYLRYFNDKGETKVLKEEFQYKGQNVFFISYRQISKEMDKKNMKSVQNNVILMNTLGFIERVPEGDIPEELRSRAETERKILQSELRKQGEKGERRAEYVRLINFYIVHNWNDAAHAIEKNARLLTDNKFSITKHNNKVSLENLLGSEVANRVFPDNRKVPKRFESISDKLKGHIQTDIEEKGYSIGEEVLRKLIRMKNRQGELTVVSLSEKEDVFRRSVLLDKRFKISKVRSEKKKKTLGFNQKNPKTIHLIELN